MTLDEWLRSEAGLQADKAATLGVAPRSLQRYLSGEAWPTLATVVEVNARSGGRITEWPTSAILRTWSLSPLGVVKSTDIMGRPGRRRREVVDGQSTSEV